MPRIPETEDTSRGFVSIAAIELATDRSKLFALYLLYVYIRLIVYYRVVIGLVLVLEFGLELWIRIGDLIRCFIDIVITLKILNQV